LGQTPHLGEIVTGEKRVQASHEARCQSPRFRNACFRDSKRNGRLALNPDDFHSGDLLFTHK
jgi:hypothetical protein